jgi:hypothetical protein
VSDGGLAYAPAATEVAVHVAPAYSQTEIAKLQAGKPAIVRGSLYLGGRLAGAFGLRALGLDGLSVDRVIRDREALGVFEVDRVIDHPIMTSWGQIVIDAALTDLVRGREVRSHVVDVAHEYPPVPLHAPVLPTWNREAFGDRDSAINFAACIHALAASRAVHGVGIVDVRARSEKVARALVDLVSVLATGSEAPRTIILGDVGRDFLSGTSARNEDDEDGLDDDEEAPSHEVLGPDPILGLCVIRDTKEIVKANDDCPIFALNMSRDDFDPAAPVRRITLRDDVWLDGEEVELAHASHNRLYVDCLARLRDSGAPISFDKLYDYLARTASEGRPSND